MRMRPLTHAITSGFAALAAALVLKPDAAAEWLFVACAATVALDLDHFVLLALMGDRRRNVIEALTNPVKYADTDRLVRLLHYPGFGILRMKAHLAEAAAVTLAASIRLPLGPRPSQYPSGSTCLTDLIELLQDPASR